MGRMVLILFVGVTCFLESVSAAEWINLSVDDRESVRTAIIREVTKRRSYDSPDAVRRKRAAAEQEVQGLNRSIQEQIDGQRVALKRVKSKRDGWQAEVERLTRTYDKAENLYESTVDRIKRLSDQELALKQEIRAQHVKLKKLLGSEAIGEVVVAVIFHKGWEGPSLSDLEKEASRLAGEAAMGELLTYIESTSLVKDGVLKRDTIIQRVAGRAEAVDTYKKKIGLGTYLQLCAFRLKPLEEPLKMGPRGEGTDDMRVSVIRDLDALRAFVEQEKRQLPDPALQAGKRLIEQARTTTKREQGNVVGIIRRSTDVIAQKEQDLKRLREEHVKAEGDRNRYQLQVSELRLHLQAAKGKLKAADKKANDVLKKYEAVLDAYRKYKFKRALGAIGRKEQPAKAAIDVILNALDEVRDDARQHYYKSVTRVENGRLDSEQEGRKNVVANIKRFKLVYLEEKEYTDDLEIGMLFETATRPVSLDKPKSETSCKIWREPMSGIEFVWIPGGCFEMGSRNAEKDRYSNEGPIHNVCVDGFWMGRHEVTNAQYRRFRPGHNSKSYKGHSLNEDNQPVVYVNSNDAKAFAAWLSDQDSGKYTFRLPTEAEWEFACRAGTKTARFWGNDSDDACSYANVADRSAKRQWASWVVHNCDDGYDVSSPVGTFKPNAFCLYDMLGNVWEWCDDWERNYTRDSAKNPRGPSTGLYRMIRGGSWDVTPRCVRCAVRDDYYPHREYHALGFRLVRTP